MTLDALDSAILEWVQAEFPLVPEPFAKLAKEVGTTEQDVLDRLERMRRDGLVRDIGPVFDPVRLGCTTTLCAARVDPARVDEVAAFVSEFPEVTHNYLREHEYNLWFTLIAASRARIEEIVGSVRERPGVMAARSLPALSKYKIRVHFAAPGGAHG